MPSGCGLPVVTPADASHSIATKSGWSVLTSVKVGVTGGVNEGEPARLCRKAAIVARQAQAQYSRPGDNLEFTGHSLGGGLAATGAMATGQRADTFNAAGVNRMSDFYYGLDRRNAANIDNHRVDGEVLTHAQEQGGLSGAMADAVGNQYALPAVRTTTNSHGDTVVGPDGQARFTDAPENGFFESIKRHSRYIDGIEQQKSEDIATMRGMQ